MATVARELKRDGFRYRGHTLDEIKRLLKAADRKSDRLSQARAALPAGTSRARVTTANARWSRAAEARDHLRVLLADAEAAASEATRLREEQA